MTASDWYRIVEMNSPLETKRVPMSPHHWTNFATGWILRGEKNALHTTSCVLQPPSTISSTSVRSPQKTSGLFNTCVPGDSAEYTGNALTVQPAISSPKVTGYDPVSAETTFDASDLDMNVFDLGDGFDQLGDASLDSFMDISALLNENTFLDVTKEEPEAEPAFTTLDPSELQFTSEVKVGKKTIKRPFTVEEEVESGSDLGRLAASVGLLQSESFDHDYSVKRPRMSEQSSDAENDSVFFANPVASPAPSTSTTTPYPPEAKHKNRREKNNIASKRSRESRKQKFVDMEQEADRLVVDNARLEQRVVQLERLAKQMKEILVAKMSNK